MLDGGVSDEVDQLRDPAPSPHERAEMRERQRILASCLARLKPRHFELLRLRYAHDATFAEIASAIGTTESGAHNMHARILTLLGAALAARHITSSRDL